MRTRTYLTVAASTLLLALTPVTTAAATNTGPNDGAPSSADAPPAETQPTPEPQPAAAQPQPQPAPAPAPAPAPDPHDPRNFINPVHGGHVISPFGRRGGRRHEGIDYQGPNHTTVYATFAGTVIQAGPGLSGYGNTVTIDHGQGITTVYAHLYSWSVRKGDVVEQGHPIGAEGQTGRATTYHVHYEVRDHGVPRDPAPYLKPA